jgi:hypothetical protein
MQRISKTLSSNMKKYNLEEKIQSSNVCKLWDRVVTELVPGAIGKTMATGLNRGVLTIASLTKEVADIIRSYKDRIMYALNSYFGKKIVYAIHVEF